MPSMQVPIWVGKDCFGRVPVANVFARTSQPSLAAPERELVIERPPVCDPGRRQLAQRRRLLGRGCATVDDGQGPGGRRHQWTCDTLGTRVALSVFPRVSGSSVAPALPGRLALDDLGEAAVPAHQRRVLDPAEGPVRAPAPAVCSPGVRIRGSHTEILNSVVEIFRPGTRAQFPWAVK